MDVETHYGHQVTLNGQFKMREQTVDLSISVPFQFLCTISTSRWQQMTLALVSRLHSYIRHLEKC